MSALAGIGAVVTGGARGIGRGIAEALAAEGASLAILDRDADAARDVGLALKRAGARVEVYAIDVTHYESVATVARRVGFPVSVVVNNAGGGHGGTRFVDLTPERWRRVVDLCLYGTFNVTHAFLPPLIARRDGCIVNISSVSGVVGGARVSVYAAAKAGIIGHTRALARELGEANISVNALCPGETDTEAHQAQLEALRLREGPERAADSERRTLEGIPLGRLARPADVGATVVFLATAGRYITGQTIAIDGGFTTV